jgi:hypothetical protein
MRGRRILAAILIGLALAITGPDGNTWSIYDLDDAGDVVVLRRR